MNLEKLIEEWVEKVYNNAEKIDPYDEHLWPSLAIGFALGMGCDLETAEKFEHELTKRHKL